LLRQSHLVIDGEAVALGVEGVADFNALHLPRHDAEVQFCPFDLLAFDGEDLRRAAPGSLTKNEFNPVERWCLRL
jgi:ATP-dependent DNA ligase